jgi:hypothetical protein
MHKGLAGRSGSSGKITYLASTAGPEFKPQCYQKRKKKKKKVKYAQECGEGTQGLIKLALFLFLCICENFNKILFKN